jgi:Glycosyl hydrolase family 59/F5/8 type C domain
MRRHHLAIVGAAAATVVGTAVPITTPTAAAAVTTITVDGGDSGRVFDGVGGVSAGGSSRLLLDYPESERREILDYLFRPDYGAALDILKVEIGADVDATVGAEPSHMRTPDQVDCDRGYEWWLMREALQRNPDMGFYGLAWGGPGWFSGGEYWSPDRVPYLVAWLECARQNGFEIDYLGAGNESGWDRDTYVRLAEALDANGFGDVRVVATDNHSPPDYWAAASEMADDPEFADAVDVLGEHDVCEWRTLQRQCHVSDDARGLGKPLWDSENSTQDYEVGAEPLARAMNRHYIDARVTGNLNWALAAAWYGSFPIGGTGLLLADRPWSGYYDVGPEIWVDAHTTQFTDPGWRYLDGGSGYSAGGASYASLRSPDSDDYTTVIETLDLAAPETLRFEVTGGLSTGPVRLWSTDLSTRSESDDFVPVREIRPVDGSFELTVRPGQVYTVSTMTGQRKGSAEPSGGPEEQLPLPYRESFEGLGTGAIAPYLSDVHGGFETVRCAAGRDGLCLRQMVDRQPITWHATNMPPTTIVGDPRWWGDYEVRVRALLEQPGWVELLGRIESQQHNAAGYHLRVSDTGEWRLFTQDAGGRDTMLASGATDPIGTGTWHRLALRFEGDRMTARVDGDVLATVRDATHTTGQVGVRVSPWQHAQFDDLDVERTAPPPRFVPHREMAVTATSEHAGNDFGVAYPARFAIDDRVESAWRSEYRPAAPLPQSITLDLGRTRTVRALAYKPKITGPAGGAITGYRIAVSRDGERFESVAAGYWAETIATKVASWPRVDARYVRLEATDVAGCPKAGVAAEINIATSPMDPIGSGEPPTDPVPEFPHVVPVGDMTATATSQQPGYEAAKAIDNDCSTMWHTSWSPYQPPPQSITLDLAAAYDTIALVYQPRQDGTKNGIVTGYEIAVSSDGQSYTPVASGAWPGDDDTVFARWAPTAARYVRLTAQGGVGGYVSAAELRVAHADP